MMLSSKVLTLFLASLQLSVVDSFLGEQTECFLGQCFGGVKECAYDNTCVVPGTLLGNCCGGSACDNGLECGTIVDEKYSDYYGYNTLEEFYGVCCKPDYGSCYNDEECCANTYGFDDGPTRQCINYECLCPSYVNTYEKTWYEHRDNAKYLGCELASVNSAAEQEYFERLYYDAYLSYSPPVFLGGEYVDTTDYPTNGYGNQKRGWTWIDYSNFDERLAQDNWAYDEPDSYYDTAKLALTSEGYWIDVNPYDYLPAIYKCCGATSAP